MEKSPIDDSKKIEALEKQLEDLKKMIIASQQEKPKKQPREFKEKVIKKESLSPNTYVKVMSLVKNPLNLSTKPHGRGKTFRFEEFGTIKPMFYSELLEVIENHPNFFQAGYFYILDSRVIEENNWHEMYSKILTKEQMEDIFVNSSNAVALFSGTNSKQQGVISDYFLERVVSGLPVDRNLIAEISKISGIDIIKRAEESKELSSSEK